MLVLTTFEQDEYVFQALRSGASGFLGKGVGPEELLDAIRLVARGDSLLSPHGDPRLDHHLSGSAAAIGRHAPPSVCRC